MRRLLQSIRRDIQAARERDPAARSDLEVVLCYPGFHARQLHRLAYRLHQRRPATCSPALVSHLNRALTGIEIHPAAQIGEGLFIDHGMGVVIGETAEIGDDVMLYQGVTLGGTSRLHEKRHPTLHDGVVVGAHAQLIGAIDVGEGARIGAGSVVVTDVPPYSTVVGVPGPGRSPCASRTPARSTACPIPRPRRSRRSSSASWSSRSAWRGWSETPPVPARRGRQVRPVRPVSYR